MLKLVWEHLGGNQSTFWLTKSILCSATLPSIKPDRKRAAKWSARRREGGRSGRNYDMDGMTMLRVIADVTFAKIDFNFLQQNVDNVRRYWKELLGNSTQAMLVCLTEDVMRISQAMRPDEIIATVRRSKGDESREAERTEERERAGKMTCIVKPGMAKVGASILLQ